MGIVNNALAGASGQGGYFLSRSLRFRSSASAYLNRTFGSTGDQQKFTFSFWVKRGKLASTNYIAGNIVYAGSGATNEQFNLFFENDDTFRVYSYANSSAAYHLITTQLFRDISAWYHIVVAFDTTQATASNRIKLYVNGVQVTAFSTANYPSQNYNTYWNRNIASGIGAIAGTLNGSAWVDTASYLDGYLTEFNFINGQQLTPSSFGETDSATGVWKPKKYSGTYGTNGFYLNFSDNSSNTSTTIGKDSSGNGNNWTPNNISVTSGSTYDSMTDVPTLTSENAANYAVLNPLATNTVGVGTLSNANLNFSIPNTYTSIGTISATSGKYYWEVVATSNAVGVGLKQANVLDRYSNTIYYMGSALSGTGEKYVNGTGSAYGASWTTNDVIGVAVDMDGGTVTFYKNNASQGSINLSTASITEFVPSLVSGAGVTFAGNVNFGQRPFAYTPPSGFKALNTFNLPTPTIGATASTQANKYFDATTFTGTGASQSVTNAGAFQPDFVWAKSRGSAQDHWLADSVRGANNILYSNLTNAETVGGGVISSFNSNGFGVTNVFTNAVAYVGWQWRASNATGVTNTAGSITSTVSANTSAGFSIATFTGTGAVGTVGHGLGVAPSMFIVKTRSGAADWVVYHARVGNTAGLYLNQTSASISSSAFFNNTSPTSSVFTLGSGVVGNGVTAVAYCFSEVAGYSRFGSYTGNGSTDGPFVFCGFRPRYVMIKRTDSSDDWIVMDSARNTYNVANSSLFPNGSFSETTDSNRQEDFLSNGFKIRSSGVYLNASGGTYIYMAFAESPFKYALGR